jgi:hypothetical protein
MVDRKKKDMKNSTFRKVTQNLARWLFTRSSIANLMMLSFILLTAVGVGMIYFPAGFIAAGVTCGLFGLLLGSE